MENFIEVDNDDKKDINYSYFNIANTCFVLDYLADINKQAEEMFDTLISQYKTAEGITEQLKADNQIEWVCKMNNIKQRVIESINENMIYN